jgi:hypothetical protein
MLMSAFAGVLIAASYQYVHSPSRVDWVVLAELLAAAALIMIIAVTIAVVRPFIVADGKIHLMRPVRLSNGVRKVVLSIDEMASAELCPGKGQDVEVWVTLVDSTRFRMVSFDDDAGRDFARRLEDYMRTLRASPPHKSLAGT